MSDPVERLANERFLTYFMLPLFGVLLLVLFAIGVGVLTGIVTVEGSRTWAWFFVAAPLLPVGWALWLGR